jgi:hypothetical protein
VRPENVFDAILLDQPLGELGTARGRRLVVVIADHELVAPAADDDPALLVDLAGGELVAVLGIGAVQGIFAGERHRGAEHDRVLVAESGVIAAGRAQQGSKQACRQQSPRPHFI